VASTDGDHLVGFANSSLRSLDQLPPPPPEVRTAKGVVMEDSLSAAFWPHTWHHLQQQWSQAAAGVSQALQGHAAAAGDAGEVQQQGPGDPATTAAAVSAAAVQAAVSAPYQASQNWYGQARRGPQAARQQQQQQAPAPLAAAPAAGPASDWHEISSGSSSNNPETSQSSSAQLVSGQTVQQQQQQQQQQSQRQMAFAVAALGLEAAGALPAATEVVAGVMQQPAAATPSTSAADSGDDLVALTYSSPVPTPSGQQAVSSTDEPGTQQQQQQPGGPASTAAVASAEADLTSGLSGQAGPVAVAESPAEAVADVAADAAQMWAAAAEMGGGSANRAALVSHMLRRLQVGGLLPLEPWCVFVCAWGEEVSTALVYVGQTPALEVCKCDVYPQVCTLLDGVFVILHCTSIELSQQGSMCQLCNSVQCVLLLCRAAGAPLAADRCQLSGCQVWFCSQQCKCRTAAARMTVHV